MKMGTMKMTEKIETVQRFDLRTQTTLLKKINKILIQGNGITEQDAMSYTELGIMDSSNCIMIIGKSVRMKILLAQFADPENKIYGKDNKIPQLKYEYTKCRKGRLESKYASLFLLNAIAIFQTISDFESVTLRIQPDYPITLENEDLKVIISPRIEE